MNRVLGRIYIGALVLAAVVVLAPGCTRPPLTGPPEMRVGRDECGECGMLVSEDRYCSALLVEHDGERLYVWFDDIGCMLDYEHEHPGAVRVLERYVRDYVDRQWVNADHAAYLHTGSENLRTPMGSGMVAFANRLGAERVRSQEGGELLDLEGLDAARRKWMASRSGK